MAKAFKEIKEISEANEIRQREEEQRLLKEQRDLEHEALARKAEQNNHILEDPEEERVLGKSQLLRDQEKERTIFEVHNNDAIVDPKERIDKLDKEIEETKKQLQEMEKEFVQSEEKLRTQSFDSSNPGVFHNSFDERNKILEQMQRLNNQIADMTQGLEEKERQAQELREIVATQGAHQMGQNQQTQQTQQDIGDQEHGFSIDQILEDPDIDIDIDALIAEQDQEIDINQILDDPDKEIDIEDFVAEQDKEIDINALLEDQDQSLDFGVIMDDPDIAVDMDLIERE